MAISYRPTTSSYETKSPLTGGSFGEFKEPSFLERPVEKSAAIGGSERVDGEEFRSRSQDWMLDVYRMLDVHRMFGVAKITIAAASVVGTESKEIKYR